LRPNDSFALEHPPSSERQHRDKAKILVEYFILHSLYS
jgi:hypothetical protein